LQCSDNPRIISHCLYVTVTVRYFESKPGLS
jgi:hypothetical protein